MKNIITYGEIMGRVSIPDHGRVLQTLPGMLHFSFAGAEANVAASIAMLGAKARFVTALPEHGLGDSCINYLRGIGVDTEFIARSQDRLGLYYLESGANQRPGTVIYDREHSAISRIEYSAFDWESIFADASWLHITGITPALSRQSALNSVEICKLAQSHGLTVSCDLNFRKKLWNWQPGVAPRDLARQTMPGILENVDVLIANEEDAADVLDIHPADTDVNSGEIATDSYVQVARKITRRFPRVSRVATTLRESISASHNNWGAMLYEDGKVCFAPQDDQGRYKPYEIRNMVDRVGGGDSFSAALIFAFNSGEYGKSNEDSLRFAVAASCLCHSIHGDINYSSREDVERLMKGNASGRVQR